VAGALLGVLGGELQTNQLPGVLFAQAQIDQIAHTHAHDAPHSEPHSNPADSDSLHPSHPTHSHGTLEVPDGDPVPSVNLVVHPDAHRGWNLELQVRNFVFAPERVNQSTLPTEGHAHLFIDGEKVTRLYGTWYYLPPLPPGTYEIEVVLSANTHEDLVYQGQTIKDMEVLQVAD
jgi:hypothetical protein